MGGGEHSKLEMNETGTDIGRVKHTWSKYIIMLSKIYWDLKERKQTIIQTVQHNKGQSKASHQVASESTPAQRKPNLFERAQKQIGKQQPSSGIRGDSYRVRLFWRVQNRGQALIFTALPSSVFVCWFVCLFEAADVSWSGEMEKRFPEENNSTAVGIFQCFLSIWG